MRFLVDALVWSLIRRGQAKTAHFTERRGAVWMTQEFRRTFTESLERRLLGEFTPEGGETMSYRAFLALQAASLRELALERISTYSPLRLHA